MLDYLITMYYFFFFKQKTAYEMRISDWSSDVCSSDLIGTSPSMDAIRQRKRRKKKATQVIKEAHKAASRAGMYALCLTLTYTSNADFCRKHIRDRKSVV